jgi:hypothetical protein
MKKKGASHSAFFNLRALIGGFVFLAGVVLALLGFDSFTLRAAGITQSQQKYVATNSIDPLVPPGFDCSKAITGKCDVGGYNDNPGGTALLSVTNSATVTAASVYVYSSGTLTGNGTVSTTNGTTVDGTAAPKGGGTTLTVGGDLQLHSGATTQCNVTPQDPSTTPQVSVSPGTVSLGGRLSVTMTGDFS